MYKQHIESSPNENLSRYYIQTSIDEKTNEWSDDRFWRELKKKKSFQL